jgi:hypothetical protein
LFSGKLPGKFRENVKISKMANGVGVQAGR